MLHHLLCDVIQHPQHLLEISVCDEQLKPVQENDWIVMVFSEPNDRIAQYTEICWIDIALAFQFHDALHKHLIYRDS